MFTAPKTGFAQVDRVIKEIYSILNRIKAGSGGGGGSTSPINPVNINDYWRIIATNDNLQIQKKVGGVWVEKLYLD